MKKEGRITFKYLNIADAILATGIVAIAAAIFFYGILHSRGITTVGVYVDGKQEEAYDINEDIEHIIETEYGHNTLIIKNGEAFLTDCDCPDALCEKMGKISRSGSMIVCLPHHLEVKILSDSSDADSPQLDAINY